MKSNKQILKTKDLVIAAVLVAVGLICANPFPYGLTVYSPDHTMKFSPVFIILALSARKYSWWMCGLISGLIDLMQAVLSSQVPNPIICVSSVLTGIIFGVLLNGEIKLPKVFTAVILSQIICSLGITSLGIWLYYRTPISALIITRGLQVLIYITLELIVLPALFIKTDIAKRIKLIH